MKAPLILTTAAVGVLAVAVGYQARENAALRQQLEAARAAARSENAALKQRVAQLAEEGEIFKAESEALRKNKVAQAPAAAQVKPAEASAAAPPAAASNDAADAGSAMRQMMANPGVQKIARQQQALGVQMMYGAVSKELGLDGQASTDLMTLLKQRQEEIFDASLPLISTEPDSKASEAAAEQTDAVKARYGQQLKDLLGERYPQFEAYERTLADRALLQQYQMQVSAAGNSLNEEQRASLLQIMTEERAKSPPNPFAPNARDTKAQLAALKSNETLHTVMAQQEDLNKRVLDRASAVLTPEQATSFAAFQKQLSAMQEAGVKMMRGK